MTSQAELDWLLPLPAMSPPPGVTPNLKHPRVHFWKVRLLTMTSCLTFITLFVMMRMYTRLFVTKSHGWEDYTCFIAWILSIPYELNHILLYKYGSGAHLWDISIGGYSNWAKIVYAREMYFMPLIFFTKLSILLQFRRIFASTRSGTTYWCIQTMIWLTALSHIAFELAIAFRSLTNVVSDLLILLIPLFCISKLQMRTSRKIGVAMVFTVGIFTCVVCILGTVATFRLVRNIDVTYEIVDAEAAGGIICGCMPIMPQFVCHIIPKIKSAFNSCSLTTKNRFSAAKSRIPKRSKIPDPYDDSCNLTGSYHMKSSPTTLNTQVDSMNTTLGPREKSSDVGSHKNPATQDLESGIHR